MIPCQWRLQINGAVCLTIAAKAWSDDFTHWLPWISCWQSLLSLLATTGWHMRARSHDWTRVGFKWVNDILYFLRVSIGVRHEGRLVCFRSCVSTQPCDSSVSVHSFFVCAHNQIDEWLGKLYIMYIGDHPCLLHFINVRRSHLVCVSSLNVKIY